MPDSSATATATPTTAIRLLPPEEYPRLAAFPGPLADLPGLPDPEHTRIVVVEQDETILGYALLFNAVHLDPLWLDPSIRHHPQALKSLILTIYDVLCAERVPSLFAIIGDAERDTVGPIARRLGMTPLAGTLFAGRVPLPPTDADKETS